MPERGPWEDYQSTAAAPLAPVTINLTGEPAPPVMPTEAAERGPWEDYQTKPPTATDEERRTVLGFLGNAATSTTSLLGSMVNVPQQVQGVTALFAGMAEKSGFKKLPGLGDTNAVDALVSHYKDRYGSIEGFKKAVYEDPAGVMFDVATVLEPGAVGLKAAGLPRAAAVTTRAARAINPVVQTVRAGEAALPYVVRGAKAAPTAIVGGTEGAYRAAVSRKTAGEAAAGWTVGQILGPHAGATVSSVLTGGRVASGAYRGAREALKARAATAAEALRAQTLAERPPVIAPESRMLPPPAIVTPAPADTSYVRGVPAEYPEVIPRVIPPERRLAAPPPEAIITEPPPDTSYVRGIPAEYPEVIPPALRGRPAAEAAARELQTALQEPEAPPAVAPEPDITPRNVPGRNITPQDAARELQAAMEESGTIERGAQPVAAAGPQFPPVEAEHNATRIAQTLYDNGITAKDALLFDPSDWQNLTTGTGVTEAPPSFTKDVMQRLAQIEGNAWREANPTPEPLTVQKAMAKFEADKKAAASAEAGQSLREGMGLAEGELRPPPGEAKPAPTASETRVARLSKSLAESELAMSEIEKMDTTSQGRMILENYAVGKGLKRPARGESAQIVAKVRELREGVAPPPAPSAAPGAEAPVVPIEAAPPVEPPAPPVSRKEWLPAGRNIGKFNPLDTATAEQIGGRIGESVATDMWDAAREGTPYSATVFEREMKRANLPPQEFTPEQWQKQYQAFQDAIELEKRRYASGYYAEETPPAPSAAPVAEATATTPSARGRGARGGLTPEEIATRETERAAQEAVDEQHAEFVRRAEAEAVRRANAPREPLKPTTVAEEQAKFKAAKKAKPAPAPVVETAPPKPATAVARIDETKEFTDRGQRKFTMRGWDAADEFTDILDVRQVRGRTGDWEVIQKYYEKPPGPENRYGNQKERRIGDVYSKAEARQVAESFLKGEEHPFAAIERGQPISEYKPGSGKLEVPPEYRFNPGGGFQHGTVDGQTVWTDGHVAFVSKPPGKLATISEGQKGTVNIQPLWSDNVKTATKSISPVGAFKGQGLKQIVFSDGTGINSKFYDYAKKTFPQATFKGPRKPNSGAVVVYSGDKPVGLIMPMRSENLPPGIAHMVEKGP